MPPLPSPMPLTDYGFLPADVQAFVALTQSFDAPPGQVPDIHDSRARYDAMCAAFNPPHPPGLTTQDLTLAGVACRRYTPATLHTRVQGVYFHGGGFVLGGLHSHDSICADLADLAGIDLIAVDYRLAPEHPHPAAFDDACAVVDALPGPLLLIGDSAGGTLAAAVARARAAQARAGPKGSEIRGQVLIYPGLGGGMDLPSVTAHAFAPLLSAADILSYQTQRSGQSGPADDPTARPLQAPGFAGLPPTALFAAECDPLASDPVAYAGRLRAAGVPVALTIEPGLVHGYLRARHSTQAARGSFARIAGAVRSLANANGPR
jgi:acetyl esterase